MKILYVICIKDKKNKSRFNEYVLCTTVNLDVANRIVDTLSECFNERYLVFWQKEFIEVY